MTHSKATDEGDPGVAILQAFVKEVLRRLTEEPKELKAADFEMIRKLLADNSITIASIKRGEFGALAKSVAEDFPFEDDSGPRFEA